MPPPALKGENMDYLEELAYTIQYNFDTLDAEGRHKKPELQKRVVIEIAYSNAGVSTLDGISWEPLISSTNPRLLASCCITEAKDALSRCGRQRCAYRICLADKYGWPKTNSRWYLFSTRSHKKNGRIFVNAVLDPSQSIRTSTVKHYLDYFHDACKVRNEQIRARAALTQGA